MESTKEKQCFEQVKCSFSARNTKNGLSSIYANVSVPTARRYISLSLKVKVREGQFNRQKGLCVVSNAQSGIDNYNNRIANDAIMKFSERIAEINRLVSEADNPYAVDVESILVPKKVRVLPLDDIFYSIADGRLKRGEISMKAHERKVSVVKSFCKYYGGAFEGLSTEVYNGYADWLVGQGLSISTINAYLSEVKTLVCEVNRTEKYPFINTQNWVRVFDRRSKEEKRSTNIMFTDDDLARIEALDLKGTLAIVRDLFVFMCNVGQRPADCARILQGEYKKVEHKGMSFIEIIPNKTKKTGKTATIPVNGKIVALMEKFRENEEYGAFLTERHFHIYASRSLKKVFELAGINGEVEVTAQHGNDKTSKKVSASDKAHLYLARHYFITKMIRSGMRPDDLIKITGHSTTAMVNEVYTHLNTEDRCDILAKYLE